MKSLLLRFLLYRHGLEQSHGLPEVLPPKWFILVIGRLMLSFQNLKRDVRIVSSKIVHLPKGTSFWFLHIDKSYIVDCIDIFDFFALYLANHSQIGQPIVLEIENSQIRCIESV